MRAPGDSGASFHPDSVSSKLDRKTRTAPKQVRLTFRYVSVWSATKISFLCGVGLGLLGGLAVIVLWALLNAFGFFGVLNTVFSGTSSSSGISIGIGQALGIAALMGPINTVAATVSGTLAAALYNLGVRTMGGVTLGFATTGSNE